MKKAIAFISCSLILLLGNCKKQSNAEPIAEEPVVTTPPAAQNTDNYSSLADFYSRNEVPLQTYTFNPAYDTSMITPQSTTIHIPSNTFYFGAGVVTLEFKEIYKKSDMLLSHKGTMASNGQLLKSSGEFFIRALNNNMAVTPAPQAKVDILIPFNEPADKGMAPFVGFNDTLAKNIGWAPDPNNTLLQSTSNYVFSLYQFKNPLSSGTWCNSDNSSYFAAFPQTTLTVVPLDTGYFYDVFLVFKKVNSMIHVYKSWNSEIFPYHYAPVGQECTAVAIAVKDKKLYSSFTPITISSNQTVTFQVKETTTADFKTELKKLDAN